MREEPRSSRNLHLGSSVPPYIKPSGLTPPAGGAIAQLPLLQGVNQRRQIAAPILGASFMNGEGRTNSEKKGRALYCTHSLCEGLRKESSTKPKGEDPWLKTHNRSTHVGSPHLHV